MNYRDIPAEKLQQLKTLGQLKAAGYEPESVKQELRRNLIQKLKNKEEIFPGIWGYEETVIPDMQRAILSMHHVNLLGLRGQAKTRIARQMIDLLDEYIPVVKGSELNDDPLQPLSRFAKDQVHEHGDDTAIEWLHRSERYTEKLATPDVSVADLIGDADPIKAATLKLPYSDERVIHFGLIPRSHRGIFVINELPDLQARIQVALFNILQEGDIQIRGFKVRMPLDIQFVFTANPEDYTNRGSIVTPLKDRIDSQIITHYPKDIQTGKKITSQEARVKAGQDSLVKTNDIIGDLIEQVAFEARESEYVDAKSGVSARLTISAFENLLSAAERRALLNGESKTYVRVSDFLNTIPSVTGKVELVYEGEQEGAGHVAQVLMGKAIRTQFLAYFPDPDKAKKSKQGNPYKTITGWFGDGNTLDVLSDASGEEYKNALNKVPGLAELVEKQQPKAKGDEKLFMMEFALHGLAEHSQLSKNRLSTGLQFKDLLSGMFTMPSFGEEEEEDEDY
ncbi:sigma 54-interacting transcriptional regulator [Pontibacter akesuensis]|uniref:Magnesium chelatase subunit I n=1 Tax=Pontibacter akesuensis TaxID=388950 RepID=A0A1I7J751_9BACT|nr:sigma 54-interacting transcriptional regulator [Pontibacter akesuensis]GHA71993.1 magnesium chelatase [Pontibacter akesuensis]SFU80998.1 magnesium chelatase subunit I [Pontibacter akesuensis]